MPRWQGLCKEGEESSNFVGGERLRKELECEHSVGWSDIPEEWLPAVKELVGKIRTKWTVDGSGRLFFNQEPEKINAAIQIEQIKDKFGSLRFYYHINETSDATYDEIEKMVQECEAELAKADPYYGVPY
jgi:hypothetical protein